MRKTYSLVIFLVLMSMFISSSIGQTTAPSIPPDIATGQDHFFVLMQGDNPATPEIESDGHLIIYDVMTMYIPWDVNRVYMHHPEGTELNYIMNVHDAFGQYSFGDSEYDDWYYWEFTPDADRNIYGFNASNNSADYSINGVYEPSELNISEAGIALVQNSTTSEYVSERLPIIMLHNVTSVTPTFESQGNVSLLLSNDDGNTWIPTSNGTITHFQEVNSTLRYKVVFSDDPVTSRISDIRVNYSYIPITSRAILRAEYILSSDHESPVFEIQKQFLYDITEIDVRLYHDPGFDVSSDNITWLEHFLIDPAIQVENKTLHQGMAPIDSHITILLFPEATTDDTTNPYLYPIVIVIIIILLTGILMYRRNTAKDPEEEEATTEDDELAETEAATSGPDEVISGPEEDDTGLTMQKAELTLQKDKIIFALKALDEDLEKGDISQEAYDELKANYKKEAIIIMKELDG
ncbi:MAG: hypothetical protein KAS16_03785 [Thermoplasmata archaeon]|nr:hypothetical protein [Thermoplasmata archaeon]